MAKSDETQAQLPTHGAEVLPNVLVDSYNLEIEDEDGFIGDKVNKSAFWEMMDKWRKLVRDLGEDPFGEVPSEDIGKKRLAAILVDGDPYAAGVVQSAIEDFAQQLTAVVRRFMRTKNWRDTECVVVGGGFRGSKIGELAIGRSAALLKAEGLDVDLELIRHPPDEAGLLGAAHLLPPWMLKGYEGILAVDIGGTNIRAGVVRLNLKKSPELSEASVAEWQLWRHGDEEDVKRDDAVDGLAAMLQDLIAWSSKSKISLAPVIGIGCPGVIHEDGRIERGAQNLPGNWASSRFNLPASICEHVPKIGEHETMVVMHNDAVVQGLSAWPHVKHRRHWGILTIGTGLGNARLTNRHGEKKSKRAS